MSTTTATPRVDRRIVELVASDGTPLGSLDVVDAHRAPGRLHRAFSVFWADEAGRLLLQRRAEHKWRFPGLWSNTCCSHPAPGHDVRDSAAERLADELGLHGARLEERGVFTYQAADAASGYVEHEYDHVLFGRGGAPPDVDPAEVSDWRWVEPEALRAELARDPAGFTPWFDQALTVLDGR
ncbi:MAG: isopentenyl-diphosphate Delta-isomerase [Streptosporangiales bacterium]